MRLRLRRFCALALSLIMSVSLICSYSLNNIAKAETESYTITYSSALGTAPESKNVSSGYTLTDEDLDELGEAGYSFIGWYYDANHTQVAKVGDSISENKTLYAYWANLSDCSVPESITLNGSVSGVLFSEEYKITNNSSEAETITYISVTAASGWEMVEDKYNTLHSMALNTKKFGLSCNGTDLLSQYDKETEVPASSSTSFELSGHIPKFNSDANEKIAEITIGIIGAEYEGPAAKAVLLDSGLLDFTYDEKTYKVGNSYTSANTSTTGTITAVYEVPEAAANYDDVPWASNNSIATANFEDNFSSFEPTSTVCWFYGETNLASVNNLGNLNTSSVNRMIRMFMDCSSLTSLDLSNFDTSNVSKMYYMFRGCSALTSIDGISEFDVSNATDIGGLFYGCSSLATLNISKWNTSNVITLDEVFKQSGVTELDLGNWDTSNVVRMTKTFYGCTNLTILYLNNWTTSSDTVMGYMFSGCSSLKKVYGNDANINNELAEINMTLSLN